MPAPTIKGKKFFKGKVVKMGHHRMIRVRVDDQKDFKAGDDVIVILGDTLE